MVAERKANSYFCPAGPLPGRAYVLLLQSDVDAIKANATFALKFRQTEDAGAATEVEFSPLYWVRATRMLKGGPDDPNSVFLVELADRRILAAKFSATDNQHFNVRSYANDADYLTGTSGATWQTLVDDLWAELPDGFGAAPALPYAPHGVPEDFRFIGANAWQAVHLVLAKVGCTSVYDPINDTFSIVRLGVAQALGDLSTPDYSAEPVSHDATRVPEKLRVYFHTHHQNYGQERDTELATNWSVSDATVFLDVNTNVADAAGGTLLNVWDDLARSLDEDNTDTNAAARSTRADELRDNFVQDAQTARLLESRLGLITSVLPGSEIKGVIWKHWGDATGMQTEIVAHPGVPRAFDDQSEFGMRFTPVHESLAPPSIVRKGFPVYPRLPNLIQVFHSGGSQGETVEPNVDGLHPGRVRRYVAGSLAILEDCWIRLADDHDTALGDVNATDGLILYGRLSGVETSQGQTLPLYVAIKGAADGTTIVRFQLIQSMAILDGASNAVLVDKDLNPTGEPPIVVNDTVGAWAGPSGAYGWAAVLGDAGDDFYEILYLENFARNIEFTLTADMSGGEAPATYQAFWGWPDNGLQPAGPSVIVKDRMGLYGSCLENDKGLAKWDEKTQEYMVVVCGIAGAERDRYAVVTGQYSGGDPDDPCARVTVQECDNCEGDNPAGAEFEVKFQVPAHRSPNINPDDVVTWGIGNDDVRKITSDATDDRYGTVKMWKLNAGDVPPGWRILTDFDHRMPFGATFDEENMEQVGTVGEVGADEDTFDVDKDGGHADHYHAAPSGTDIDVHDVTTGVRVTLTVESFGSAGDGPGAPPAVSRCTSKPGEAADCNVAKQVKHTLVRIYFMERFNQFIP